MDYARYPDLTTSAGTRNACTAAMTLTDRENLRRIARERCESGNLPKNRPLRTWAGPGNGQPCSLCEQPIAASQMEYEAEVPDGTALRVFRFHLSCLETWLLVCVNGLKT